MSLCGPSLHDVVIALSTGEVFYWYSADHRYISCFIPIRRPHHLSLVCCSGDEIRVISDCNDVFAITVEEQDAEDIDPSSIVFVVFFPRSHGYHSHPPCAACFSYTDQQFYFPHNHFRPWHHIISNSLLSTLRRLPYIDLFFGIYDLSNQSPHW